MWRSSEPASPASRRPGPDRGGSVGPRARGPRPRRRAHAQPRAGGRLGRRARRPVGRTRRNASSTRWIDELGLELFETYDDGLQPVRVPRPAVALSRGDPEAQPDRARRHRPGAGAARPDGQAGPARRAVAGVQGHRLGRQTVATWIKRHTHTGAARAFFQLVCEAVWAVQPADLSLLHFLFYVHSGGGIDALISTDGGAQQHRIVGGSQLIAIRAAARARRPRPARLAGAADRRRRRVGGGPG